MRHFIFMGRQRGHVKRWIIHTDLYDLYNLSSGLIAFSRGFCFCFCFSCSFFDLSGEGAVVTSHGTNMDELPCHKDRKRNRKKNGGKNTQDKDVRTHAPRLLPVCLSSSLFRSSTTEAWRFRAPPGSGRSASSLLHFLFRELIQDRLKLIEIDWGRYFI